MGLIDFIKPSMQGNDGKASARALTNFWYVGINTAVITFMCCLAHTIVTQSVVNAQAVNALKVIFWVFVVINLVILLIFGIITAQNVNESIRAIKGQPQQLEIETKTNTTVTPVGDTTISEKSVE